MKIAVFPGSFDPFTRGHEYIVNKALEIFDQIIIAIGTNTTKKYMFTAEERKEMISKVFDGNNKVEVETFEGLTVDFCELRKAKFILRGLRNGKDFEYEKSIALMNTDLKKNIETVFLLTRPDLAAISSTILREIIKSGGSIEQFIPERMSIPEK